ncbi:MAG: hypothetical protein AB8B72_06780 [Crocinitomicaceae bacterium]
MNTVEDIVKRKEFYELTAEERLIVKDVAQNETEFNEFKHLLIESSSFFEGRKVTASSEMREHIMEKLYPPTTKSIAWYQSIWFFLFPSNKSFYQYPAFQFATILVVFFGVFTLWKSPFETKELAVNTKVEIKEIPTENENSLTETDLTPTDNSNGVKNELKEEFEPTPVLEPEATINVDIDRESKEELVELPVNANSASSEPGVRSKFQEANLETTDDEHFTSPIEEKEILAEDLALDIDENTVTNADYDKSFSNESKIMAPTRLEKKDSEVSVQSVSSIGANLFKDKSKNRTINITEIGSIQSLFFEVK